MINTTVDNDIEDCGTKHFIKFKVDNQEKLNMIIGRHYYRLDQKTLEKETESLGTAYKQSSSIIGETIGLRSPITCACKNGKICRTCYGRELATINSKIHNGLAAVLFLTNPLTQKLLSAKHLLSTSTEKVEWGGEFEEHLMTNMNYIFFNDDTPASISINWKDVMFDDDDTAYITKFEFTGVGKKTIPYETPKDGEENLKLYLNEVLLTAERDEDDDCLVISPKTFPDDTPIFSFTARNNELSKSLQQILDLIESKGHLGISNMSDFANKFADLLIENGMNNINSVHVELIGSILFRDEFGDRLDFTKEDLPDYELIRISKAIMNGPLSTSLAFERLNDQFVNLQTYEKNEKSYTDYLFK